MVGGQFSRRQVRQGGGRGTGEDHLYEMLGAVWFEIFITPNRRPKGYPDLKRDLEALGCSVEFPAESRNRPTPRHQVIRAACGGKSLPPEALRRAHQWAHGRNFLHSFFKPMFG